MHTVAMQSGLELHHFAERKSRYIANRNAVPQSGVFLAIRESTKHARCKLTFGIACSCIRNYIGDSNTDVYIIRKLKQMSFFESEAARGARFG